MADSSGQERTEEATPRKRQQARRKGTVARSHDLTSALVIIALLLVLPSAVGNLGSSMMSSVHGGLRTVPHDLGSASINRYFWSVFQGPALALMPILLVATGVGLAANFAQGGLRA